MRLVHIFSKNFSSWAFLIPHLTFTIYIRSFTFPSYVIHDDYPSSGSFYPIISIKYMLLFYFIRLHGSRSFLRFICFFWILGVWFLSISAAISVKSPEYSSSHWFCVRYEGAFSIYFVRGGSSELIVYGNWAKQCLAD